MSIRKSLLSAALAVSLAASGAYAQSMSMSSSSYYSYGKSDNDNAALFGAALAVALIFAFFNMRQSQASQLESGEGLAQLGSRGKLAPSPETGGHHELREKGRIVMKF